MSSLTSVPISEVFTSTVEKKCLQCKIVNVLDGKLTIADGTGEVTLDVANHKPHQGRYLTLGRSIRIVNPGVDTIRGVVTIESKTHIFQTSAIPVNDAQTEVFLEDFVPNQFVALFTAKGK